MMIDEYLKDDTIVITPIQSKMTILAEQIDYREFSNIKFMSKEEFFSQYYFSYDERAYFYLMEKYHYHLDVCKLYLKNMYFIEDKNYQNKKLQKLKSLKEELVQEGLLAINQLFQNFVMRKKIIVYQYPLLEKYERECLERLQAIFIEEEKTTFSLPDVKRAKTLEDEIVYVAVEIRKLFKKGVPFSKIRLINVYDDDIYTITRIFKYFQIPVQLNSSTGLFGMKITSDYLKTGELDLNNDSPLNQKLIEVVGSLSFLEDSSSKRQILIDKLKHTSVPTAIFKDAVSIGQITDCFKEDDYVFFIGLNQDLYPHLLLDDDYILDNEKGEVSLYTTDEKNLMIKEQAKKLLQRLPHLSLSFRLESSFQTFYPSSFIEEVGLQISDIEKDIFSYSHLYNKLLLSQKLDDYYKFGVIGDFLFSLYTTYPEIAYHSYDASFTGVQSDKIKSFLNHSLSLSYTHLQNYYLCGFKYYVNHILKLDPFTSTFASVIGNMFHEALKYMDCEDFDLDYFMCRFLENGAYSAKERFFLRQLKEELGKTIAIIREQREYTKFRNTHLEKTLLVDFSEVDFQVILKGTIDKIMYYENISDTYYAIVDYKSGTYDTNLSKIQFGLNMQLPIYLYLVEKSRIFSNSIFTGFYYQRLLLPKKTYENKEFSLPLEGYSCSSQGVLEMFDNSYRKSELVKGLSMKQDGSFSSRSKLLNEDEIESILKVVEEKVLFAKRNILQGNFPINPKYLEKENISCKYCKYKDLCFMKEKDLVYLTIKEQT